MNWVDGIVVAVVLISGLIAFARGFVAEALGIGGWIGAYFVALFAAPLLMPTMRGWIGSPDLADPAAYGAVFLVALIVLSILTGMIGSAVRSSMLGGVDRTLGIVFGLARGLVICAAIYVGATFVDPVDRWPDAVARARSVPHIYALADWLVHLLPPGYRPKEVPAPPHPPATTAAELLHIAPQGRATGRP
jgi:membrane protein required for colicin V production